MSYPQELADSERECAALREQLLEALAWLRVIGEAVGCRGDEAAILQRVREVAESHAELVRTLNATIPVLYRADNPAASRLWSEQLMRALNRAQLMRALNRAERVERRP